MVYPNSSQITDSSEIVGIDSLPCSSTSFFFLLISLILAWFVEKILGTRARNSSMYEVVASPCLKAGSEEPL